MIISKAYLTPICPAYLTPICPLTCSDDIGRRSHSWVRAMRYRHLICNEAKEMAQVKVGSGSNGFFQLVQLSNYVFWVTCEVMELKVTVRILLLLSQLLLLLPIIFFCIKVTATNPSPRPNSNQPKSGISYHAAKCKMIYATLNNYCFLVKIQR